MLDDLFALPPGLRVIVTAGASGIGRAIADLLIARGAQACTSATSPTNSSPISAPRIRDAGATKADVASEADVERLFAEARASLGGLDALVNNAGIAGPTGGVEEIAPADWRRTLDVCLTGQFLCAHHAVPLLKAAGGGAIVNMSSSAGRFGYAFRTPYSAAKWGVIGFTQSLAKELGPVEYPRQRHPARHRRGAADDRRHRRAGEADQRDLRGDGARLSRARLAAPHGDGAATSPRRSPIFCRRPDAISPANRSASTAMSRRSDA